MAQPARNISSKRHVERDSDSGCDDAGSTASQASEASGRGGDSPRRSGQPPTVSASTTTAGASHRNSSTTQPSPTGKAGATGSQPTYASGLTPAAREQALRATANQARAAMQEKDALKALRAVFKNAEEVRLEVPASLDMEQESDPYTKICALKFLKQIPIRHLELRLDPCGEGNYRGRTDQIAFVTELLTNCNNLAKGDNSGPSIAVDVAMLEVPSSFGLVHEIYARTLYRALAESRVVNSVRIKDYQPKLDKSSWLLNDELLGGNRNIRLLELKDCEFNDGDGCELAFALKENNAISRLVFSNCNISDKGVRALASVFSNRPDLEVVGFQARPMGSLTPYGTQDGKGVGAANNVPVNSATTANTATTATTTTATLSAAAPTTLFDPVHAQQHAASAVEVREALKWPDPAPILQQLFSNRAEVRIEVPVDIPWETENFFGSRNGYEVLCSFKCLSTLTLRDIQLLPQAGDAGRSPVRQLEFLGFMLDSLGQLPGSSRQNIRLDIVLPSVQPSEGAKPGLAFAQDSLFKSLALDRLTVRLDMGKLAPRDQGSMHLCRYFESLARNLTLAELKLCGATLNHSETLALAEGLRGNRSIQRIDLSNCILDLGAKDFLDEAASQRSDLRILY